MVPCAYGGALCDAVQGRTVWTVALHGERMSANRPAFGEDGLKADSIIVHCSDTPDRKGVCWSAIRTYHTSWKIDGTMIHADAAADLRRAGVPLQRPWSDIGYHFGVERVGAGFEILVGRMADVQGAHCRAGGMNRRSLGICFVGDFDLQSPPPGQWQLGIKLVAGLMRIHGIAAGRVFGHREFDPGKTCPGRRFDLDLFRRQLTHGQH